MWQSGKFIERESPFMVAESVKISRKCKSLNMLLYNWQFLFFMSPCNIRGEWKWRQWQCLIFLTFSSSSFVIKLVYRLYKNYVKKRGSIQILLWTGQPPPPWILKYRTSQVNNPIVNRHKRRLFTVVIQRQSVRQFAINFPTKKYELKFLSF